MGDFNLKQPKMTKAFISRCVKEYEAQSEKDISASLKLYRDVFGVQKKNLSRLVVSMPRLDEGRILTSMEEGTPLIDPESIELDYTTFAALFRELKEVVARKSRAAGASDREFLKNRELSDGEVEQLGRAWLEGREDVLEAKAGELGVAFSLLSLLLHTSFAAVFRKLALELYSRMDLDQSIGADCPVCGAPPVMGFNRGEDGLRVLECCLCGSRWGTPRMLCLFCGTPDQKQLRYLFVNDDHTRRIHVCEKCKTYIKIVDCKEKSGEIVLPLEDIFTTFLDDVAAREGYERGCRTVFS